MGSSVTLPPTPFPEGFIRIDLVDWMNKLQAAAWGAGQVEAGEAEAGAAHSTSHLNLSHFLSLT